MGGVSAAGQALALGGRTFVKIWCVGKDFGVLNALFFPSCVVFPSLQDGNHSKILFVFSLGSGSQSLFACDVGLLALLPSFSCAC